MKFTSRYIKLIVFHAIIGVIIYLNETLAKVYFFSLFFYFLYRVITCSPSQKVFEVLKACAYIVGAEMILRMTRGSISYESGKYLVIFFCLFGMFYKGVSGRAYPYFIYLMFLLPSIFVASNTLSFDANFRTNIAFVLSGPVCLGIAALFCFDKRLSNEQLLDLVLYMLLPIVTLTAYVFFYAPSIGDILSTTASNRRLSGGFGPNQVSTILGLGMFLSAINFFLRSPTMLLKAINILLFVLISYRALLTFSRGGVFAAVICIAAFLFIYFLKVNFNKKAQVASLTIIFVFSMGLAWLISSKETSGYIDLRYANKDHFGREKEDLTTGRGDLFLHELEGFISNPFWGIGSSRAKDSRIEIEGQGVTSHSEVSRTLSEHGLFGVIMLIILFVKPLDVRARHKRNILFYAFLAFWFATINHSSMRLAAPAFIYALSLILITREKRPVHR
jgi:hypothetical protein